MAIWNVASIDEEPEIVLTNWVVFVATSKLWSEQTLHFVGYNVFSRMGRVSSAIIKFDCEKSVGMTESGRIYRLQGPQGSGSLDGLYLWNLWCQRNEVSESEEISLSHNNHVKERE